MGVRLRSRRRAVQDCEAGEQRVRRLQRPLCAREGLSGEVGEEAEQVDQCGSRCRRNFGGIGKLSKFLLQTLLLLMKVLLLLVHFSQKPFVRQTFDRHNVWPI
jgi:hypothetical protein